MGAARFFRGLLPVCFLFVLTGPVLAAGLLVPRDGSKPIEVKSHEVTVWIEGGLAKTTLRQTFVNPHRREMEAIYAFPVPIGAALTDVAMEVNGTRLPGLLVERQRGRKIYDDIVASQQDPALVEQIGPDTFRLSVYPVLPRKETVVELTWVQQLPTYGGVSRYVYPLALAMGKSKTRQEFSFNLTLRPGEEAPLVTSPVKDLKIASTEKGTISASFTRQKATLDQDVVVDITDDVKEPTVSLLTFRRATEDGWFQVLVRTPKPRPEERLPHDLILVLDTSRSMRGVKIEQAKQSALALIDGLLPGDAMTVVAFSALSQKTLPATAEHLDTARNFIKGLKANGGTSLGSAIELALTLPKADERARSIVLLTDGVPTLGQTEPKRIVELARKCADQDIRIFAFGLGGDVNPVLLSALARVTNGRSTVCRSAEDLESRLSGFLDRIASPSLEKLTLEIPGAGIRDVFPQSPGDAFPGETISFTGRYDRGGKFPVAVRAVVSGQETALTRTLEFRDQAGGPVGVKYLFGRRKLSVLEERYWLETGLSQEAYFAALDAGAYSAAEKVIAEMVEVSLLNGVQCAFTAFLVLLPEDRMSVPPEDAEAIARARLRAAEAESDQEDQAEPPADDAPDLVPDADDEGAEPPPAPEKGEGGEVEAGPEAGSSTPGSGSDVSPSGEANPHGGSSEGDDDDGGGGGGGPASNGKYYGPSGEVPPKDRHPDDPQPRDPPEGGGDSDPGTGGSGTPAPEQPTAGSAPSIAGAPASGPGRKRTAVKPMTFDHWLFWWAYNRDEILHRRWQNLDRARTGVVIPEALPALRAAAKNQLLSRTVRAGAIVSLGRAGDPADGALLRDLLRSEQKRLGMQCALALGLLGDRSDETRDLLFRVAGDQRATTATRSAALIAVGLIGIDDEFTLLQLKAMVSRPSASSDLPVSALLAIGLIGSTEPVPELISWLEGGRIGRKKLRDIERAWIAEALGRIGDPRSARPLMALLRAKHTLASRSAAIALGQILPACGGSEQVAGAEALCRFVKAQRDVAAVNFAVIALGRLVAEPTVAAKLRRSVAKFLLIRSEDMAGKATYEPFNSLALGLATPGMLPEDRQRTLAVLTKRLSAGKGDRVDLGAVALSLGLAGDDRPETVALLIGLVEELAMPPELRGAAATALGLLGAEAGTEAVLGALRDGGATALEVEVASAAALLGDRSATTIMLSTFRDQQASSFALGSAALALGRLGDRTALPMLIDLLGPDQRKTNRPDRTRALAARAIGYLADSTGGGALTRLSLDLNYRAMVPALSQILSWQ